jgi:hypothetical protein
MDRKLAELEIGLMFLAHCLFEPAPDFHSATTVSLRPQFY